MSRRPCRDAERAPIAATIAPTKRSSGPTPSLWPSGGADDHPAAGGLRKACPCDRARRPARLDRARTAGEIREAGMSADATAAAQAPLPRSFGRYALFDFIGKGGMAEIYLARQKTEPRRDARSVRGETDPSQVLLRAIPGSATCSSTRPSWRPGWVTPTSSRCSTSGAPTNASSSPWSTSKGSTSTICSVGALARAYRCPSSWRCTWYARPCAAWTTPTAAWTTTGGRSASCIATCRRRTCSSPSRGRSRCATSASHTPTTCSPPAARRTSSTRPCAERPGT